MTCPLCKAPDIPLAKHLLTYCGWTYRQRLPLLRDLKIDHKKYNAASAQKLLNQIYHADRNHEAINIYTSISADHLEFAEKREHLRNLDPEELIGRIIDIRQNEAWYRTRVIHYDHSAEELNIDNDKLDKWPFDYYEIDLDDLRNDETIINGQCAMVVRNPNVLSFSNLENNAGKTIYAKGHPIKLVRHIDKDIYETDSGSKVNLKLLINRGDLNQCLLNGNVARRYASAYRRESNAERYGNP